LLIPFSSRSVSLGAMKGKIFSQPLEKGMKIRQKKGFTKRNINNEKDRNIKTILNGTKSGLTKK
jgi:hypothetical protein